MAKAKVPGYLLRELNKLVRKVIAQPDFNLNRLSKSEVERVLRDPATATNIAAQLNATGGFSFSPTVQGVAPRTGTMMATRKGTEFAVPKQTRYSDQDVTDIIDKLLQSPEYGMYGGLRSGRSLGGYHDGGNLVLDPAARFSRQSMADVRGRLARQNAGFDLDAGEMYPVTAARGLRGAATESLPYAGGAASLEALRRLMEE
jgi:hypothetical protein